ncbi:MAG: hypothetical protein K0S27_1047 [Gammaproteobacteria bacterium]|jgi:hypothetical protein|nr:hypothetical protein [Gammaproteobacteria bacterium]
MRHSTFLIAIFTLILSSSCLAKIIKLYEKPASDAKVLATLDLDKPTTLTIIDKDKEWTSIVDPTIERKNARIVWIKTIDLPTNNYTFTHTMVDTGQGPHGYVMQYGVPKPLTAEQAAALTKQIQLQQQAIANYFSQLTKNIFQQTPQMDMNYPFIIPVVVMPEKGNK